MPYDNNVPQASQTVAATQSPINGNFAFIQTSLRADHNFNALNPGQAEGTHLQVSMPNQSLSPVLPTGCNGTYFINSGLAFFFDGTRSWVLNDWQNVLSGTYTPTSTSSFNTVVAIPANTVGQAIFYAGSVPVMASGTFFTDGATCYGFSNRIKINGSSDDYPIELNNSGSGLNLSGRAFSSAYNNKTYTYKIFYRPA